MNIEAILPAPIIHPLFNKADRNDYFKLSICYIQYFNMK